MQSRAWPRSNALEYLDAACGEKGPFPNRVRIALPYTAELAGALRSGLNTNENRTAMESHARRYWSAAHSNVARVSNSTRFSAISRSWDEYHS